MPYKDPEKEKACQRKYRDNNKDKEKDRSRKYYEDNRDKVKLHNRKYYEANSDKANERRRKHYKDNIEKEKQRMLEWQKENSSRLCYYTARRRAIKLQATPTWANKNLILEIYKRSKMLGLVVDHIIPLKSKLVCGLHWEGNLQLLTRLENSKKYNKLIELPL